jgi:hypothetical protein
MLRSSIWFGWVLYTGGTYIFSSAIKDFYCDLMILIYFGIIALTVDLICNILGFGFGDRPMTEILDIILLR